jgi:hypothetical protein
MSDSRLRSLTAALVVLAGIACRGSTAAAPPAVVERQLTAAAAWADSVEAVTRSATDERRLNAPTVVVAGYLERLRLGLGSPFRLVEYAWRDPRLSDSTRVRLGMALLSRTLRAQEAYEIDPAALGGIGARGRWWGGADGVAHRALIEGAIEGVRDPRAGEVAVRIAYALARAEGEVGRQALPIAAQVAALVRDRALAQRDAAALVAEAARGNGDALAMVSAWRATGRFLVERPALDQLTPDAEVEAMRAAPTLLAAVRAVGNRVPPPSDSAGLAAVPAEEPRSALGPAAARRLGGLASVRAAPPQAPIAVTLRAYRERLLDRSRLTPAELAARARLVSRAHSEEALVAEYAGYVASAGGDSGNLTSLAVLSAAVAMRPLAQEPVWFPAGGPTAAQLRDRWGIASVSFDSDVPAEWRPYYLRLLATGIADLQRVLPALDLRGVGFHFGERVMRDSALAMHDPVSRTIFLPVETGGGTLAHEVVHDLDWQIARQRYGLRGAYSTDWAVREQVGGRMATSLRGLTAATLIPPMPENHYRPPHGNRPAEVLARNADWFVAVSLAHEGRMNGYLTAVQDELLTGYAGVTAPDLAGDAASAVADLLDDMTFVAPPTRAWFLSQYGRGRALGPYDLVRRVLTLPDSAAAAAIAADTVDAVTPWNRLPELPRRAAGGLGSGVACTREEVERAALERSMVALAAESRVRGLLRRAAYVARWSAEAPAAIRALNGGPWEPTLAEDTVGRASSALLGALGAEDVSSRPFRAMRCGRL